MTGSNQAAVLWEVLNRAEDLFEDVPQTEETGEIVDEIVKIEGFHPTGYFELGEYPTAWWWDVYKEGEGREFLDRGVFQALKMKSIESRMDPIAVCRLIRLGTTPKKLENPGFRKYIISLVYPFVLPTPENLAGRKAEEDLQREFDSIFGVDFDLTETRNSFKEYLLLNYKPQEELMLGTSLGDYIMFMLDSVAAADAIVRWDNLTLKAVYENAGFIENGETNFTKIAAMLDPIVEMNSGMHKFHPILGVQSIAETLYKADFDIGITILAGGLEVNWSAFDFEDDLNLKLFFLILGGELF